MKLAVIADTHGNLSALEAVLRDMEEQGADAVVCLGDVASFGPQPRETLERVRRLGCPVVQGNADAELVRPDMADVLRQTADTSSEAREIISWCARQLDKDDLAYLAALPLTAARKVGGVTVLAVHGSPRSFDDRIVASTSDEQLGAMLEGVHASIVVGGHTHTQLLRRYQDITFVNPGSVGLPFAYLRDGKEAGNPHRAEYALIEAFRGQPSIIFRRVPYDIESLVRAVRESDMPYRELWLEGWLRSFGR